ncbi:MAG: dihydrodipicolinate synthase family protein [Ignavibacteriales bacterium]|nr:dihydrodipicolinate synthase family protein [Ignavibacteriales bacterium]
MTSLRVHGIIPPIITPFKKNGDIDYEAFVQNIERWNNDQLGGYLVLGSNSEAPFLTHDEKLKLIELTVANARKGRTILAGTGLESSRKTIHLTNEAARLGAHAALVLTPSYYIDQMEDAALIRHFTEVADQSDIPILIYNVPKFTHVNVSVNVIKTAGQHPNIIGMKDSSGNVEQLSAFFKESPENFQVIVGTAGALLPALRIGIRCAIPALANAAPNHCAYVQRFFEEGLVQRAEELQQRLTPVNTAVTATHGVAGLKHACTLMGYHGGCVRSPLMELTDHAKKEIQDILSEAELLSHAK